MIDAEVNRIGHIVKIDAMRKVETNFDGVRQNLAQKGVAAQGGNHADRVTQQ